MEFKNVGNFNQCKILWTRKFLKRFKFELR